MDKINSTSTNEEELIVQQLIEGLDQLENLNDVDTPTIQWFEQTIELEKKRIRKKLLLDLFSFIFVAVCILTLVISVTYHQPLFYFYFQLIGIFLLPLVINQTRKKVKD